MASVVLQRLWQLNRYHEGVGCKSIDGQTTSYHWIKPSNPQEGAFQNTVIVPGIRRDRQ